VGSSQARGRPDVETALFLGGRPLARGGTAPGARHPAKAIVGWLVFVALAMMVGGSIGTQSLEDEDLGVGEARERIRSSRTRSRRTRRKPS
jgi:hypothetical protein